MLILHQRFNLKNGLDRHFNALYVYSANFNGSCFVLLDGARIVLELPLQD